MTKKFNFRQFLGGEREDRSSSLAWLTIYGDMMTNLMLFFLMLWALTRMSLSSQSEALSSFQKTIIKQQIKEEPTTQVQNTVRYEKPIPNKFDQLLKIKSDLQGIRIIFDSPVLFDLGSAKLKPSATKSLDELVAWLSDTPYTIIVEGHTDNIPIKRGIRYLSNWELSLDRARSVVKYFQKMGLEPKRLVVAGYGEHHPVCANDTEQHMAANRRIEVYVVYRETR